MIVCVCKGVSDRHIRVAVREGCVSVKAVSRELGVATQCGKCACHARDVIHEEMASQPAAPVAVGLFVPQPA